jgi:hypothetical protein
LLIGIPVDTNAREGVVIGGRNIGNAQLAFWHEFGTVTVPARPFLIPGVASVQEQMAVKFAEAARDALLGNTDSSDQKMSQAGIIAVRAVQRRIQAGIPPPLRPGTIAARRRRSPGSSYRRKATTAADTTPLIDTGSMLRSITWVIRNR